VAPDLDVRLRLLAGPLNEDAILGGDGVHLCVHTLDIRRGDSHLCFGLKNGWKKNLNYG
jgi:hypothetical protein